MRRLSVFLVYFLGFSQVQAFSWDEFNVDRLFSNSEEIFSRIPVDPHEKPCVDQFKTFVSDVKSKQTWASKVIDAWSKEPPGLYSKVDFDFGHFDQCISLDDKFPHHHCLVKAENARNFSYDMTVCLPRTCSEATAKKLVKPFFENLDVQITEVFECYDGSHPDWGVLQWSTFILCLVLLIVALVATIFDLKGGSGLFLSFSLYRNTNKLVECRGNFGPMGCLNGIRVLSMTWIILLHSFEGAYYFAVKLLNSEEFKEYDKSIWKSLLYGGQYSVDTFFVIGGLLLAYNFMRDRKKAVKFNVFKYILHRWLRLAPVFGMIMLLFISYSTYFRGPPQEYDQLGIVVDNCKKYWWSSILMIQNFVNPNHMCIAESWYIQVDFQLYILSPLLLFPLAKYGRKTAPVFVLLTLVSAAFLFTMIVLNDIHFNLLEDFYWNLVYAPTQGRFGPWVIGMALGYYLFKTQEQKCFLRTGMSWTFWLLSGIVVFAVFYIPTVQYQKETETVLGFAFFHALHRPLWSLAVAWLIFACIKGYAGPANWIFSFSFFQPLNKLSYSMYIMNFLVILTNGYLLRSVQFFSSYLMFHLFGGIYITCMLFAIPIVLLVELPIGSIEPKMWSLFQKPNKVAA